MIIRLKDSSLVVLSREDCLTDDDYYMKCANAKGVLVESPEYGSEQMNKIINNVTMPIKSSNKPIDCSSNVHKYRQRTNSTIEK